MRKVIFLEQKKNYSEVAEDALREYLSLDKVKKEKKK
jgi:hypothetical protein